MIYNKHKYLKFDIMKKHRFFRSFQDNLNDLTSLFILLWELCPNVTSTKKQI